ncbi:pyridoxamine 5'-phosphate oxidase family protein [Granulosicoccus sp.]|jgi:hypothetical protein|nr:pyridoxamine 5'-phosphate oxidase family protein [Granulosicoccus sp.]MDB4224279.1 pyridoxamine 5'-phosphate oxidase family protein [Granulosicoccus sp.]
MPQWEKLSDRLIGFIEQQPLFFVATASQEGRVNLSPKGMDSLIVIDHNRITWLNVSGSGNETAAHIKDSPRMTLMFCAFDGDPMILRVYGTASVLHPRDPEWDDAVSGFPKFAGSRQIFNLTIDLVQTSCGTGVPIMPFQKSRAEDELLPFYAEMGEEGVKKYWSKKNSVSLDGKPTGIFE